MGRYRCLNGQEILMSSKPPFLAQWILKKLLRDDFWKTMLGDLEEYYHYLVDTKGLWSAKAWYWSQVLRYAPSKLLNSFTWTMRMFLNYLKISRRSLIKNKSYSVINISGLAIGLASWLICST